MNYFFVFFLPFVIFVYFVGRILFPDLSVAEDEPFIC